ncbi:Fe2+ uptake regulation protein [Anoxybacillus flavithermus NBRC 109594]|uniref:Fe2+ uptake regulation protein n=1 Tax=Anoxybacillus flavithermus NBRC 109594 TaxID=1315967 RepID=R4F9F5_9BACL|nr:hypothetical protein [Anoxybacillus flavithermus]GAC90091.1 Fe2+ uptake regulation protein [Anoxybacillus flavithermus NBRC 109594]
MYPSVSGEVKPSERQGNESSFGKIGRDEQGRKQSCKFSVTENDETIHSNNMAMVCIMEYRFI